MVIESIAIIEDDHKVRHYLAEQVQLQVEVKELRVFADAETALEELASAPVKIALFY